jgi:hypothetical protein
MPATVYVLEGAWSSAMESPMILPYLTAYANSHNDVKVQYRTIRCKDDVAYYVSQIRKGTKAFLYIACHGFVGQLHPTNVTNVLTVDDVCDVLGHAKDEAISFIHFGSCQFVHSAQRRNLLEKLRKPASALWVSGYTKSIDWLPSTWLDLALISEVYVPWRNATTNQKAAKERAHQFIANYDQLARSLGFSGLSTLGDDGLLIPTKLSNGDS